ncbi:hypothetical protein [Bacillus thuringiensis]|uniref:hypothetical protein n=1 Tax=Bacillus thuringiensis TaxID=1428 RepID=UPI0015D510AF|nr:hypothetical protein [Bacillus thuringiensis]
MQKWKLIYQVIIFLLLVGIGIVKYATPIGNWAWFTACIGIFFILQSLTKNIIVQKNSSPLKRRAILLCFFLFIIRFFGS